MCLGHVDRLCVGQQVYLRGKDVCDYTGGESYVFDKSLMLVCDDETHETLRDPICGHELKVNNPRVDLLWFPQVKLPQP